ncbi:MAG: ATP-binding protein [Bryobacteraceae bacterium]
MPTALFRSLRLKNVRCFADAKIPLDPRVTVIIGANGSGKTTVIEALASLTYGEGEGLDQFPLRKTARTGRIALYAGKTRPAARWKAGGPRQRLPDDRYLFAYG